MYSEITKCRRLGLQLSQFSEGIIASRGQYKLGSTLDQLQTTALIAFIDDNVGQLWFIKPNDLAAVINDQL